jgi:anthranilate phosphoribosyltransferase
LTEIQVHSVAESVELLQSVLRNQPSAARDVVLLNAGAAIYAAQLVNCLADGIAQAQTILAQGLAQKTLTDFIALTHHC